MLTRRTTTQRPALQRFRDQQGVTLVELLVVLVVLGVVGGVVVTAIVSGLRSAAITSARVEATNELRIAMQRMSRDLRTSDAIIIEVGDASSYADLNNDITLDIDTTSAERLVRYRVATDADGGRFLEREDTSQTLVTALANDPSTQPLFTYFTSNGSEVTCGSEPTDLADESWKDGHRLCSRASQVRITMIRELPDDRRPVEVESMVTIRNVRYRTS